MRYQASESKHDQYFNYKWRNQENGKQRFQWQLTVVLVVGTNNRNSGAALSVGCTQI